MRLFPRLLRVLARTIVIFGSIHLVVLGIASITRKNWEAVSAADVFGVTVLFPDLSHRLFIDGAIWIMIICVFAYFLRREFHS